MVGEEEVTQTNEVNTLQEGAGENGPLKANGNFEPCPHRPRYTYFIQIEDRIRVGSAVLVQRKIDGLREHYSKPFTVVAVVPQTIAEPAKVYKLFAGLKARRGWLWADSELLYFIEAMKPHFVDPEQLERDRAKPILTPVEQAERDMVSGLMVLRGAHGAESDIGHGISNVLEVLSALKTWVRQPWMSDVRQTLPWIVDQQLKRIARLTAAAH